MVSPPYADGDPSFQCTRADLVFDSWRVISKNARINSEERLSLLLAELSGISWNIICFSETRCPRQDVTLVGGHRLICEYGSVAASGVAILVHKALVRFIFKKILISDRVMALDVKIGSNKIRIIAVYMPHAGYEWQAFLNVFDELQSLATQATDQGMHLLVAGDFNLSLGSTMRGDLMKDFVDQFALKIANGNVNESDDSVFTHIDTIDIRIRIDYILYSGI